MFTRDQLTLFDALWSVSKKQGVPLFVVGGVLRDIFLGEEILGRDVDFVVEGNAIDFGQHCAEELGGELRKFPDFCTVKLVHPQRLQNHEEIDLAAARTEVYGCPGALPVVSLSGIDEDLSRRDFTMNAMAVRVDHLLQWINGGDGKLETLYGYVLDPYKGRVDLQKLIVRILHSSSFLDDPTRLFRASRYVTRIAGRLDGGTEEAFHQAVVTGALNTISHDRKINEVKRIFKEVRPERALRFLLKTQVFHSFDIFPVDDAEELFLLVKKVSDFNVKRGGDFMFNLALRLFYHFCSLRWGENHLKKYGFGRKQLKQFKKDLEDSRDVHTLDGLSNEALVLALTWDENRNIHDGLAQIGRRRGLIVCSI